MYVPNVSSEGVTFELWRRFSKHFWADAKVLWFWHPVNSFGRCIAGNLLQRDWDSERSKLLIRHQSERYCLDCYECWLLFQRNWVGKTTKIFHSFNTSWFLFSYFEQLFTSSFSFWINNNLFHSFINNKTIKRYKLSVI